MISGLTILAIGFFLGMRHATDPDHVIAVSTIVSREPSIGKAGLIGALWGLGHTLTILLVGAAIILFNVAIPARVGLTMELAVGLMLILLGMLNLTGVTRWLSEKFSPAHPKVVGEHVHVHEHGAPGSAALVARPVCQARRVPLAAAALHRHRSWAGGIGGRGAAGADHDS
jgi:high-affinity nickel-transport protein